MNKKKTPNVLNVLTFMVVTIGFFSTGWCLIYYQNLIFGVYVLACLIVMVWISLEHDIQKLKDEMRRK